MVPYFCEARRPQYLFLTKTHATLDPANELSSALACIFNVKSLTFPRILSCSKLQEVWVPQYGLERVSTALGAAVRPRNKVCARGLGERWLRSILRPRGHGEGGCGLVGAASGVLERVAAAL